MSGWGDLFAIGGVAFSAYNSWQAGRAQEDAAGRQIENAYLQIEYVKQAAKIESIADVDAATSLMEKTELQRKSIDTRESQIISAMESNEQTHIKNTDLLTRQANVILSQKRREASKSVSTARSRAAGAGIYAGGGAAAEVAKDASIEGSLERARVRLQLNQAQAQLDEQISDSRFDALNALQTMSSDRETLDFNYAVASRQQELSINLRDIERDAKISALETGAQVIRVGVQSPELGAFETALEGLARVAG
jgi:hypothetical protein|tara:strand:- start:1811 stop:2566 length:756 start_codon:yes stop_codon:yes gene_type:complete